MHLNEPVGVDRRTGKPHIHHARIGEHEHHEVKRDLYTIDLNPTQLPAIDLALRTRHHIQHRLVVTLALERMGFFQGAKLTSRGTVRNAKRGMLLLELA